MTTKKPDRKENIGIPLAWRRPSRANGTGYAANLRPVIGKPTVESGADLEPTASVRVRANPAGESG